MQSYTVQLKVMAVKVKEQKSKLDAAQVIRTAYDVVDREGLDALTIRHLANRLSVTPMALYWHFADKQALIDALVDQMWADARSILAQSTAPDQPLASLQHVIRAMVEAFRAHPTLATLAPMRVVECEAGLDIAEDALALLGRMGLTRRQAAFAARMALTSAIMLVSSLPGVQLLDDESRDEIVRIKLAAISALPPQRYPFVIAAGPDLVDCDNPEDYYSAGIDMIVAGVLAAPGAVV